MRLFDLSFNIDPTKQGLMMTSDFILPLYEVLDFSWIDALSLFRMRFRVLLTSFLFHTRFEAVLFLFRTRFQIFHELMLCSSFAQGLEFFWLFFSFVWELKLFFSSFARDFKFFTNWCSAPLSTRGLEFFFTSFLFRTRFWIFHKLILYPSVCTRFRVLLTSFLFRTRFEAVLFLFCTRFQNFHELMLYPSVRTRFRVFSWLVFQHRSNQKRLYLLMVPT